jgi:hypothetical protein
MCFRPAKNEAHENSEGRICTAAFELDKAPS